MHVRTYSIFCSICHIYNHTCQNIISIKINEKRHIFGMDSKALPRSICNLLPWLKHTENKKEIILSDSMDISVVLQTLCYVERVFVSTRKQCLISSSASLLCYLYPLSCKGIPKLMMERKPQSLCMPSCSYFITVILHLWFR